MAFEADPAFSRVWESADREHRATQRNVIMGTVATVTAVIALTLGVKGCSDALPSGDPVRQANVDRCVAHLRNLPPPIPSQYEKAVIDYDPVKVDRTLHEACEATNGNSFTAIDHWATALNSTTTTLQS